MYYNTATALKIFAAKRQGIIRSNARFWRDFCDEESILRLDLDTGYCERYLAENGIGLLCALDENFPSLPARVKPGDIPCLFAYKGDISLLEDRSKNVAVVGTLSPTADIVERERKIVEILTHSGLNIVSGLATGCDTVAHSGCIDAGGKTIAFLPTSLDGIYPRTNAPLAQRIIESGGLVITEYAAPPANRYERINRFIERDRLQAMFAANIILIASHDKGQGDSGSRHAMQKAAEYGAARYVMYDRSSDLDRPIFALNKRLADGGAAVLTPKAIDKIVGKYSAPQ